MVWRKDGPPGREASKIRWEIVPYTAGRGLDVGCGPDKAFPHFIGVDNMGHAQKFGWQYKPDIGADASDLSVFSDGSMDFVFSSHTLEHIEDFEAALKEWWRVIKMGGHLVVYLPHKDFYPNIGQDGANPDHKHDFLPADIVAAMRDIGHWDLRENQERNEGIEYSFLQVYQKREEGHEESWKADHGKKAAVIRYGAFGDVLQASSILPGLKAQGYHVTMYTVPRGYEVIKHDPHIDRFIVQDHNQVPNAALGDFWEYTRKKYDKFVNLSESVEGTFLSIDSRQIHFWPTEARHAVLDHNYSEVTHKIAGVPLPPMQKFYPNEKELAWVTEQKELVGRCILWPLSGSSVHKFWPHMDPVVARILTETDYKIVFTGDEISKMLEQPWTDEPRIFCRSGEWTIRQTLSFAQVADMVLGPETGVLNSVASMDMPKIVLLSHSSKENLTKHWNNTYSVVPVDTPCYPCHQMHYNFDYCSRDEETGTALCQANISADMVWDAFKHFEGL